MDNRTYDDRKEYYRQWALKNPEKVREHSRQKYLRHKAEIQAKNKAWWDAHPNWEKEHRPNRKSWDRHQRALCRLRRFGVDEEQLESLLDQFDHGPCDICGTKETVRFHMDHNHETGKFRGILCDACNKGIGFLQDNMQRVQSAVQYLT